MTAGAGGWVLGICVAMAASPWASGQTPRRYTMDREIQFERGTDGARRLLTRTPEAREIVAGPFDIAAEDFNGDGAKEIVLIATSGPMCSDRGCSLVILEKRPGKIVAIGPTEPRIEAWLAPTRRMPSDVSTMGSTVETAAMSRASQYTGAGCSRITWTFGVVTR